MLAYTKKNNSVLGGREKKKIVENERLSYFFCAIKSLKPDNGLI